MDDFTKPSNFYEALKEIAANNRRHQLRINNEFDYEDDPLASFGRQSVVTTLERGGRIKKASVASKRIPHKERDSYEIDMARPIIINSESGTVDRDQSQVNTDFYGYEGTEDSDSGKSVHFSDDVKKKSNKYKLLKQIFKRKKRDKGPDELPNDGVQIVETESATSLADEQDKAD